MFSMEKRYRNKIIIIIIIYLSIYLSILFTDLFPGRVTPVT